MKTGMRCEVLFATNRGVQEHPGFIREVRKHAHSGEIRQVVVKLDSGRLCVANPASVRAVVSDEQRDVTRIGQAYP